MKLPPAPHAWDLTPREAIRLQRRLASRVRRTPPSRPLRLIAGLDAAFSGDRCIAGVVLWDLESRERVEQHVVAYPLTFPYVPGLLSFREAPALLAALARLRRRPDVLLCDGHGLAHPRRFGVACHLGVAARVPSVGCAKSRLVGTHREPGAVRGSRARLVDDGDVIGCALRTREGARPVYASIGHRVDLEAAVGLVLRCALGYRLPEPPRLADRLVAAEKRRLSAPRDAAAVERAAPGGAPRRARRARGTPRPEPDRRPRPRA